MEKDYKVLKGDELTRLAEGGGIERYRRYQLRTKGGMIITVDIGEKDFTDDKAGPIFLKAATEADKILKLGG
jgi:hypothetical protein